MVRYNYAERGSIEYDTPSLEEILNGANFIINYDAETEFVTNYPPRAEYFDGVDTSVPVHIEKLTFSDCVGWSGSGWYGAYTIEKS